MDELKKTLACFYSPKAPEGFTSRVLKKTAASESTPSKRVSIRLGASFIAAAAALLVISLSGFDKTLHTFSSNVCIKHTIFSANISSSLLKFDAAGLLDRIVSNPKPVEGE